MPVLRLGVFSRKLLVQAPCSLTTAIYKAFGSSSKLDTPKSRPALLNRKAEAIQAKFAAYESQGRLHRQQ